MTTPVSHSANTPAARPGRPQGRDSGGYRWSTPRSDAEAMRHRLAKLHNEPPPHTD
jgi:hypothetical protein